MNTQIRWELSSSAHLADPVNADNGDPVNHFSGYARVSFVIN